MGESSDHTQLAKDIDGYVSLLRSLVQAGTKRSVAGDWLAQSLTKEDLKKAAGLAFLSTYKIGLGLGVSGGSGILINRLPVDDGQKLSNGWSAPVFIALKGVSIGATAGYSSVSSIVVLDTQYAVLRLATKSRESTMTPDANVAVPGLGGYHMNQGPNLNVENKQGGAGIQTSREFSLAGGAIVDVSSKMAFYNVDDQKNKLLYGPDFTAEAILCGKVDPPPEMMPLYEELELMTGNDNPFS
jgi:lipid-binding SYLF domain-containing protein